MALGTGEVVRELRKAGMEISESDVAYAVRSRSVQEPELIAGRRAWEPEDVEALREYFEQRGRVSR